TAILRAPELSATSRIDRIWIIGVLPGLERLEGRERLDGNSLPAAPAYPASRASYGDRLPNHPLQRPPLPAAERARFDDLDPVADLRGVLLVVHHERRRAALLLAIRLVPHLPFDGHHDALLHLVADDDAR